MLLGFCGLAAAARAFCSFHALIACPQSVFGVQNAHCSDFFSKSFHALVEDLKVVSLLLTLFFSAVFELK